MDYIEPHTAKAHALRHEGSGVPCGCWTGEKAPIIACRYCGAAYLLSEVNAFIHWTCYDCSASVHAAGAMPIHTAMAPPTSSTAARMGSTDKRV